MSDVIDSVHGIRFRGGIAIDSLGWRIIVELNGVHYDGRERYVLEETALAEYQIARRRILDEMAKAGLRQQIDLRAFTERK